MITRDYQHATQLLRNLREGFIRARLDSGLGYIPTREEREFLNEQWWRRNAALAHKLKASAEKFAEGVLGMAKVFAQVRVDVSAATRAMAEFSALLEDIHRPPTRWEKVVRWWRHLVRATGIGVIEN